MRLVAYSDAPLVGGAEHSLATLLRHLAPRFEVGVVATDPDVGEFLAGARDGTKSHLVPGVEGKRDLGNLWAQLRAIRALRPDLVHVNLRWIWTGQYGILGGLLAPGAQTIAVEHAQPEATHSRAQRFLRRKLCERLGAHVAVGDRTARSVEAHIGLPEGSVLTIHNGVEDLGPAPAREPGDLPTVGAIGRLVPEKGFDDIPRALARIPGARAIVVGDGPERERIEELAVQLRVQDRLKLVGWQADPRKWMNDFDVLAVPSRIEGSPPLVALDAMMMGIPVVASDVGAVSEAIDDSTGALVPPRDPAALADAVTALLGDTPRRLRLGRQARSRALTQFAAGRMTESFEGLYDRLCTPAGRPMEVS